MLEMSSKCAT